MSIASELSRLQQAKSDLATSIANKGVTVPAATTIDGYAALVDQIQTGGGFPYDAQVEWIEGGMFQTSFVPAGNAIHTWKYMCKKKANYSYVLSCRPIESGKWYVFGGWNNDNVGTQILYGSSSAYGGKTLALNTEYVGEANFSGNSKTLKWNGSTVITLNASTITNTYPFAFALGTAWRLYWYECRVNGVLVSNIIPVRKGQVGYLYDRVSGELIENTGTGSITLGADIT